MLTGLHCRCCLDVFVGCHIEHRLCDIVIELFSFKTRKRPVDAVRHLFVGNEYNRFRIAFSDQKLSEPSDFDLAVFLDAVAGSREKCLYESLNGCLIFTRHAFSH